MSEAQESKKVNLITLEQGGIFVLHWTGGYHGPDFKDVAIDNTNLQAYVDVLWEQMVDRQAKINRIFRMIDLVNLLSRRNEIIFRLMLDYGNWAMKIADKLNPLALLYVKQPTNFLYQVYIYRLEEIYTKCFATTFIFGDEIAREQAWLGFKNGRF